MNPYNWQSHNPKVQIPRSDVERVAELLSDNGSAVVLGGRGMGKSVFLGQLRARLEEVPGVRVLLVPGPPAALTVEVCMKHLARVLDIAVDEAVSTHELFSDYFAHDDAPERLVLLFDELDRYAEKSPGSSANPPGRGFFNDLEWSRRALPRLGVLATGSVGVFIFRDILGSSFLARALHLRLRPFDRSEVERLAEPFGERGTPLGEDVLGSLLLAAGGVPALLTYGLQELWKREEAVVEGDVTDVYARFQEEHGEYLRDLLGALNDPALSEAPQRVWERIQHGSGRILRSDLEAALGPPSGALKLNVTDVLHLLEAVGVVRLESSAVRDDPVTVYPIAGLLNLPGASTPVTDFREHFLRDLRTLLEKIHRSSADFFRSGRERSGKQLVPESVFAAHLALGFDLLGWRTEREAQRGAGRTDLVLRRNGAGEVAVLEVKVWGRNDYKDAHRQVESYWTSETSAGAVVQLTDREGSDWSERYRRECLGSLDVEERPESGDAVRASFTCASAAGHRIDHFVVQLKRRW